MTQLLHQKTCKTCSKDFPIYKEDLAFYKKLEVPEPTLCPACREQRRLVWRNERTLYSRKCDRTDKPIISYISPDKPITVYSLDEWFANNWDTRDYGLEIDFTKPFFEQFRKLLEHVPHIPLLIGDSENSKYTNFSWCNKNCYMISAADYNEDCFYSGYLFNSQDCSDCFFADDCELCYECVDCEKCYDTNHCQRCKNSNNCWYCEDLIGCNDCIGCINLRNQRYCILNKKLPKEEYKMIIVTNQGGIGTKEYTEEDLAEIHKKMLDELSQNNVTIDGIYYCPHAPVAKCNCRKPKPTMIEKAKNDFKINLSESYFIGDKTGDIKAGENAGCKTILVKTGYAGKDNHYKIHPNHVAKDLYEAINIILNK